MRLSGRVALLVGATDGIGRATAHRFAKEGAKIAISGRREKEGQEVVGEIDAIVGNPNCALFVKGDVTVESDMVRVVNETVARFGGLDVLVNCAAKQGAGTILEATKDDYIAFLHTNVMGMGLTAKAAIPHLLKSKHAAIVNLGSLVGHIGVPGRTLYCVSKAAVVELTKCMACDFPSIRINCISPGFTSSRYMMAGLSRSGLPLEETARLLCSGVLMERMATPDEVANVILFLASDEASYITGENIMVDGGALCHGNTAYKLAERLKAVQRETVGT
jgi:NAD(P)-dependent dehydrogenase (short-subunit alcohol dehydrogenase family)